jgi:hypothetical protein
MRAVDILKRAREKRELAARLRRLAHDLSDPASISLLVDHAGNLEIQAGQLERDVEFRCDGRRDAGRDVRRDVHRDVQGGPARSKR